MNAYYLIGEHLGHSFSAELHRLFGRYDYALKELSPGELGPFLRARAFAGLNVTIPYKEAVLPYLDRLDETAAAVGAVNTVVNRDGELWGYNTDLGGMRGAFRRLGLSLNGKTVLILGTGGSSKTALALCRDLGAAELFRVSRTGRAEALRYEEAYARFGRTLPCGPASDAPHLSPVCALVTPSPEGEGSGLAEHPELVIINCSPVGMWPRTEEMPLDPADFPRLAGVFDCVYNPLRTRLVLEAQKRGVPASGGLYMLVKQAALACELFTGLPVEDAQVYRIYDTLRRKRENIVLIGMPGAGKTTVGRLLAQKTGKEFVDLDEELVRRAGKSIPTLFAEVGEAGFRDLETGLIRELAFPGGRIVATGGGAVLRVENVLRLKQSGRLIWLDRPLEALEPFGDRPLGDTLEKLRMLYTERCPIYRAAADLVISDTETPEAAARAILEER